jgi:S-adenosylmethionine hydrolase
VLHADHFGNLVTNVLPAEVPGGGDAWSLAVGGHAIGRWGRTYGDADPGELVVYAGSVGFLEVAVRDGSAAQRLAVRPGADVTATRRLS